MNDAPKLATLVIVVVATLAAVYFYWKIVVTWDDVDNDCCDLHHDHPGSPEKCSEDIES